MLITVDFYANLFPSRTTSVGHMSEELVESKTTGCPNSKNTDILPVIRKVT